MKKVIAFLLIAAFCFSCTASLAGPLSIHTLGPVQYVMNDDYKQIEKEGDLSAQFTKSTATSFEQYYLWYDERTSNSMEEASLLALFTGTVKGHKVSKSYAGGMSEALDVTLNDYPAKLFHYDAVISDRKFHWHHLYCVTEQDTIDISFIYTGEYSEEREEQFLTFLQTVSITY